jgi:hypothetical protein
MGPQDNTLITFLLDVVRQVAPSLHEERRATMSPRNTDNLRKLAAW